MIAPLIRLRIAIFGVGLLVVAFWVGRRAIQLQVRESEQLRAWAETDYLRDVQIPPRRGRILDRKNHPLATTVDLDSVYCNPRQLAHVEGGSRKLAKALHLDVRELDKTLAAKKKLYFAWVKRRVSPEESRAVAALELRGVGMRKEPRRIYPSGTLAATVIGHAGLDGRGQEGVELGFEAALHGTGMELVGVRDNLGRSLLMDGAIDSSSTAGKDLVLSLDSYLTHETERILAETVRKHNAKAGMSVTIDPRTGEILAMASVPTYNPNEPADMAQRGARNRTVADFFEPGSTLKTFTFAAALDSGKLRPSDRFDCQMGRLTIGKFHIRDDHPKGIITAAEVFKHSSNIGTVKIARRIGKEALWKALDRFGFGRPTYVGLPGERQGILRPVSRWGDIELATHAFGQGLTVTPLQLAAGFAAIAAYGVYHPPRLALRYVTPDHKIEPVVRPPQARGEVRVMSESAARTLLTIMQGVTEDGTAKAAAIPGYPVAGKTGTAQKVSGGRYDPSKYLASFVGIVPANDPRLVILVMIDEPLGIHYGGVVAAPAFKAIAELALSHLGVAPTVAMARRPAPAGKPDDRAVEPEPERPGLDQPAAVVARAEGGGDNEALVAEDELQGAEAPAADNLVMLPDFAGLSMGEAIHVAHKVGVELVPSGSGLARTQTPKPGPVPPGTLCRVSFERQGG